MPKRQAKDLKKKHVTRKSRKTVASASSDTKKQKLAALRSTAKKSVVKKSVAEKKSAKKSVPEQAVVTAEKKTKPVTSLSVPKRKRVVRGSAMAEMQQRASQVVPDRSRARGGGNRTSAMHALASYSMVLGAFVGAVVVGAFVIRVSNAATFQGPSALAPLGNIPVTIWNAQSTGSKQNNADIDIAGTISSGAVGLDLGVAAGGQNLMYGFVPYATMHDNDALLKLETEAANVWIPRFSVNKDGDTYISGQVGIGTTNPALKLDVDGDIRVLSGGSIRIANSNTDTTNTYLYSDTTGTARSFGIKYTSAGSPVFYIDSVGKVGIGDDSPGYPLDVASPLGTAILSIDDTNAGTRLYTGMRMARAGTEQWFVGMNATDDDFHIRVGAADDVVTVNPGGDLRTLGAITAQGCFGATFTGVTTSGGTGAPIGTGSYKVGDILSYYGMNNKCAINYPGSHACTVNEMLESIRCSVPASPIRTHGGTIAWINGGPPGFTANSNDCIGWTNATATAYGRYWSFDNVTGGFGTMTTCNAPGIKVACCS